MTVIMPIAMAPLELRIPIAALGESSAANAIAPAITRIVTVGDPRTREPIKRPNGNRTRTRSGESSVSGWIPRAGDEPGDHAKGNHQDADHHPGNRPGFAPAGALQQRARENDPGTDQDSTGANDRRKGMQPVPGGGWLDH